MPKLPRRIINDNKECVFRIDKKNCLALNWKDCTNCKFFKSVVFITQEIIKQKADYKKERQIQKEEAQKEGNNYERKSD
jgi:hypothetical protein